MQERVRELIQVLEELLPFLYGKGTCTADPLFPLAHEQPGEGKDQPKEALACSSGGWASSALRELQLWMGLCEVWPTFL